MSNLPYTPCSKCGRDSRCEERVAELSETIERMRDVLTWLLSNRTKVIFIGESDRVNEFFKKCYAALNAGEKTMSELLEPPYAQKPVVPERWKADYVQFHRSDLAWGSYAAKAVEELAELEAENIRLRRLYENKYVPWQNAGGPKGHGR